MSVIWIIPGIKDLGIQCEKHAIQYKIRGWKQWLSKLTYKYLYVWDSGCNINIIRIDDVMRYVEEYYDYETGDICGGYSKKLREIKSVSIIAKANLATDFCSKFRKQFSTRKLFLPACNLWMQKKYIENQQCEEARTSCWPTPTS